jgi:hypothetical protein
VEIEITDNSAEVLEAMEANKLKALEQCGLTGENFAKLLCQVDTGNLRNSITHTVDEGGDAVYIGTNSEYGAYVIKSGTWNRKVLLWWASNPLGLPRQSRGVASDLWAAGAGLFETGGVGQCGHLSEYYRGEHEEWVRKSMRLSKSLPGAFTR